MTPELRQWIMNYRFADNYDSEAAWKKAFELFKHLLKMQR